MIAAQAKKKKAAPVAQPSAAAGPVLMPAHAALVNGSGISSEVAAARGYRTVTKKAELRDLGFGESQARVPALLIPIHDVAGKVTLYQIRPDVPRIKDGKALKYETPIKARMVLDVPPGARAKLGDPSVPLFITEGVRKADAAVSMGLCCVALLGVWNWRGTNDDGGKVALPDWESVALNGRQTYIVFDSDVMLKPEVGAALSRLKEFLETRGATVAVIYLPAGEGGTKVGLDDYLAASHGVDDLMALATPTLLPTIGIEAKEPTKAAMKGRVIELDDPEPSDDPVIGAEVLDEVVGVLNRFIVLPPGAATAIALWVAHTYLMDAFDVTPLLAPSSPAPRCGKTSLLKLIAGLSRRPLAASGISAAAIFRTVEEHEPTLIVDEMDSMKDHEDLRGVLNSGHSRELAFVIRMVGEGSNMEPRRFSTWCPKVVAHIGRLPGTLEDRAIRISMRRKLPGERRERIRRRKLESLLLPVRRRLARWAMDAQEQMAVLEPTLPEALDDRGADNWEPLLAIADAAGGRWPVLARSVAVSLSSERGGDETDNNPGLLLLADLRDLVDAGKVDTEDGISGEEACAALRTLEERHWKTWGKGKDGLLPVHLARLLRPFGIRTALVRAPGRRDRRYSLDELQDVIGRYLRPESAQPVPPVPGPDPFRVSPDGSGAGTGGTGGTGSGGRNGSEGVSGIETEKDVPAQAPIADPSVWHHDGLEYRVGDRLPDGRLVESVDYGIPTLVPVARS